MKRLLSLLVFLPLANVSWAQLSRSDAAVLVSMARLAAAFPVRAEICGWTNANTTWDALRYLAASHYVRKSEYRTKLTEQQMFHATQMAVENEQLLLTFAKQLLESKPCNDNSISYNKAEWEKYVVQLNEFADREVERLKGQIGEQSPATN